MKAIVGTVLVVLALQALGAIAFIYSGFFNVAATDPHWPITHSVLETARVRSVKAHATAIRVPDNLADHNKVVAGTSHFAGHCASCHSAPGVEVSEVAIGMYPNPPALTDATKKWAPRELFWIIRHGIKMSGMPAWPDHSDDDIWNIIAFIEQLPKMSEQDYGNLVKESMQETCAPLHRAAGHC